MGKLRNQILSPYAGQNSGVRHPACPSKGIDMHKLNPTFRQAYAITKAIPKRKNKNLAILAWCQTTKKAIRGF